MEVADDEREWFSNNPWNVLTLPVIETTDLVKREINKLPNTRVANYSSNGPFMS